MARQPRAPRLAASDGANCGLVSVLSRLPFSRVGPCRQRAGDFPPGGNCSPDSPFYERGYYISVWRQTDPESVAHVAKPGVPIERISKPKPHELSPSTRPYSPP